MLFWVLHWTNGCKLEFWSTKEFYSIFSDYYTHSKRGKMSNKMSSAMALCTNLVGLDFQTFALLNTHRDAKKGDYKMFFQRKEKQLGMQKDCCFIYCVFQQHQWFINQGCRFWNNINFANPPSALSADTFLIIWCCQKIFFGSQEKLGKMAQSDTLLNKEIVCLKAKFFYNNHVKLV